MFKITIEETKQVRKTVNQQWEIVKRDGDHYEYGYAPEVEKVVTETQEVYRQTVEELDLAAVIIAVNKLFDVVVQKK